MPALLRFTLPNNPNLIHQGVLLGSPGQAVSPQTQVALLNEAGEPSQTTYVLGDITLLAPVKPGTIYCVGLNYEDHRIEMNHDKPENPVMFLKAPGSLQHPNAPIVAPTWAKRVDYEGELALVIGKTTKNIPEEEALSALQGITIANDVTARSLQKKDGQWARAKSFDTFCPLGPWLVPLSDFPDQNLNIGSLSLTTRLNGEIKQHSNTANMIFSPAYLVHFISQFATLQPGDIILTGTPGGIGAVSPGDEVAITIEGIGTLFNPVIAG